MANVIIKTQPASIAVVTGQNTTFSVTPSADFASATYAYQWKLNTVNIAGANSSSYFIDPLLTDNGKSFTVAVSALSATASGRFSQATVTSNAAVLTVSADSTVFNKWARYPESGKERFLRMRNLGYC